MESPWLDLKGDKIAANFKRSNRLEQFESIPTCCGSSRQSDLERNLSIEEVIRTSEHFV